MLIRFEVANFRSIVGPAELSMVAVDRERPEARAQAMIGESLLPVAAVFGPNASGKSNVVAALAWLCDAVAVSLRAWEDRIPVEPFAFGDGPTRPSAFTVEAMIDGVRFEYIVELDREHVSYEGLFHYPEKRARRVFEREGNELKIQRGLGGISGTRELLTAQTLALSAARRFDEPLVGRFARKLLHTQVLGLRAGPRRKPIVRSGPFRYSSTARVFEQVSLVDDEGSRTNGAASGGYDTDYDTDYDTGSDARQRALGLLKLADLGIDDVVVDRVEAPLSSDGTETYKYRRIRLVHRTAGGPATLDFGVESEGTRTWFGLIAPILNALETGTLLLFDELDASLHPTLSAQLLRLFQSPVTNPRGAQLVFTTHDTSLLNHLNRDEVWLTSKDATGATRLGALAEFAGERVRQSVNLENAYLHGRFGALPEVDQTEFLRALGLIG